VLDLQTNKEMWLGISPSSKLYPTFYNYKYNTGTILYVKYNDDWYNRVQLLDPVENKKDINYLENKCIEAII
jgi:hypothetical protein